MMHDAFHPDRLRFPTPSFSPGPRESGTSPDRVTRQADAPVIRPLSSAEDFRACVALQRATWGADFNDVVPAHLAKVTQRVGGICSGAFDADGTLLGFVFGITGYRAGEPVHWSDMLAVREDARRRGIGRMLKEHQRDELRERGVRMIQWTFDPLVAANAHLNLSRLGARVSEYVVDMYADSNSPLHSGFGTDRLIVTWDSMQRDRSRLETESGDTPVINVDASGEPLPSRHHLAGARELRIEVPADIFAVLRADPATARLWREATRAAFVSALRSGMQVTDFVRDGVSGRCFYQLTRLP